LLVLGRIVITTLLKLFDLGLNLGIVFSCQIEELIRFVDTLREQLLILIIELFVLVLDLLSVILQLLLGFLHDVEDLFSRLRFDFIEALLKSAKLLGDSEVLATTFLFKAHVTSL